MAEHTPGPWEVEDDDGAFTIQARITDPETGEIDHEPIVWQMGGIDCLEDAVLIAAAPDLLAACEAAMAQLNSWPPAEWGYREMMIAEALEPAIKKARGII